MTQLVEFRETGIVATTVSRMERDGEAVRLAQGVNQLSTPRSMRNSPWPK